MTAQTDLQVSKAAIVQLIRSSQAFFFNLGCWDVYLGGWDVGRPETSPSTKSGRDTDCSHRIGAHNDRMGGRPLTAWERINAMGPTCRSWESRHNFPTAHPYSPGKAGKLGRCGTEWAVGTGPSTNSGQDTPPPMPNRPGDTGCADVPLDQSRRGSGWDVGMLWDRIGIQSGPSTNSGRYMNSGNRIEPNQDRLNWFREPRGGLEDLDGCQPPTRGRFSHCRFDPDALSEAIRPSSSPNHAVSSHPPLKRRFSWAVFQAMGLALNRGTRPTSRQGGRGVGATAPRLAVRMAPSKKTNTNKKMYTYTDR